MARVCCVSLKRPVFGHNVSHANNKTNRVFYPNVRWVKVYSRVLARSVCLKLTPAGVRTLDKHGGIDGYINQLPLRKLSGELLKLRKAMNVQIGI